MSKRQPAHTLIQDAVARTREKSIRTFHNRWLFTADIKLRGRRVGDFASKARIWLDENCDGNFDLRLDIAVAGFVDEADAVAFALWASA